ncbi:three-helix bundle dimerization domain-containing protein [Nonomuraea sp. NPDC050451]
MPKKCSNDRFANSPVRDFIPVLVEHDSKELLRGGTI